MLRERERERETDILTETDNNRKRWEEYRDRNTDIDHVDEHLCIASTFENGRHVDRQKEVDGKSTYMHSLWLIYEVSLNKEESQILVENVDT